jgi:hypothetical protein
VVVLTHSVVTARGCAASSVVSHAGIGLIVLGAVLLLGSFALALHSRRQVPVSPESPESPESPVSPESPESSVSTPDTVVGSTSEAFVPAVGPSTPIVSGPDARVGVFGDLLVDSDLIVLQESEPVPAAPGPVEPEPVVTRRPIAPGEDVYESPDDGLVGLAVRLPPGWYGNPDIPGKPVQWWDGTKLTDGPG